MPTKSYLILQRLVNNKYKRSLLFLDQNRVKLYMEDTRSRHSTCHLTHGESPSPLQWGMGEMGSGGCPSAFQVSQLTELSLPVCPPHLIHIPSTLLSFTSVLTQDSKGSHLKLGTHKLLYTHLKTPGIVKN